MERSMDEAHERPVVTERNKERVRAGHTGDHVRYILMASCALVIIAFIAIAFFVR
jgi:Flp pilus assembly protein TadB